jgi:hypothetical protein
MRTRDDEKTPPAQKRTTPQRTTPQRTTPQRTVRERIELLRSFPPDAEVHTEGCDCVGLWSGTVWQEDGIVIIGREQ